MWLLFVAAALAGDPGPLVVEPLIQLRPRFEGHSGRDGAPGGDQAFVIQRTRAGVRAAWGPLTTQIVLQDVRAWGEEGDTLRDFAANGFDLHEGWAEVRLGPVSVRAGRQEIGLHEERLIGAVGWAQQGRSFDGARVSWKQGLFHGDAIGAWLASTYVVDTWEAPGGLGILRVGAGADAWQADALAIFDNDATLDRARGTLGAYARGSVGPFAGRVEAYGQTGRVGDQRVAAWMVGAKASLGAGAPTRARVGVGYDHLSGDRDPEDDRSTAFDTLYATNFKYYGRIDIVNPGPQGLQDGFVSFSMVPFGRATLDVEGHVLARPDGQTGLVGAETDVWMNVPLVPWRAVEPAEGEPTPRLPPGWRPGLALEVGAAGFFYADGRSPDGWGYLMVDAQL
ncbi:MAG TPA: alginate export family protein [Myxococcota bacterium]|nr:alginate export family protein [Myxococcota bacterium]